MSSEEPISPHPKVVTNTIPITPYNSPSNTALLEVIKDPPAILDNDYTIGTPQDSSSPETIDGDGSLVEPSGDGSDGSLDTPSKESCQLDKLQCFYDEITQQNNREITELNAHNEQLNTRVIADDEMISTLLDKLQENQDKYDCLVNNKKYCPWTWLQNVSNNNYLTYGIVGLIVIIGGSKAIFR